MGATRSALSLAPHPADGTARTRNPLNGITQDTVIAALQEKLGPGFEVDIGLSGFGNGDSAIGHFPSSFLCDRRRNSFFGLLISGPGQLARWLR